MLLHRSVSPHVLLCFFAQTHKDGCVDLDRLNKKLIMLLLAAIKPQTNGQSLE